MPNIIVEKNIHQNMFFVCFDYIKIAKTFIFCQTEEKSVVPNIIVEKNIHQNMFFVCFDYIKIAKTFIFCQTEEVSGAQYYC